METSEPLLPTPRANDSEKRGAIANDKRNGLPAAIQHLLPTPTASSEMQERIKRKQNDGRTRHSLFLTDAINQSRSSQVDFPASLFPKPDEDEVRRMIATSGRRCFESYESFIRGGSSVRTLVASLLGTEAWYSNRCNLIWKTKITKFKRLLFQLAPSARRTGEIESGLLLTPNAEDAKREGSKKAWEDYKSGGRTTQARLRNQITAMLPTPAARDFKGSGVSGKDTVDSLIERGATKGQIGQKTGLKLQPAFVEWMMGFPEGWTELPDSKLLEMRLSRRSQRKS